MGNQYNQFIQSQMRQKQPDKEKLIGLATKLRQTFHLVVHREAILTFDHKDKFIQFSSWVTEAQFKKYIIHVPDLLFFVNGKLWIVEIDGYIHNVKDSVVLKDIERNRIYSAAKLNFKVINEWDVLFGLGKKMDRSATVQEIWPTLEAEIKKIIKSG